METGSEASGNEAKGLRLLETGNEASGDWERG